MSTPACLQRLGVLPHGLDGLGAERDRRSRSAARAAGRRPRSSARPRRACARAARSGPTSTVALRREQADPAVARRLHGGVRLGRDHADDGNRQRLLQLGQRGRGGGVAGDEDQLHALRLEVRADLVREAARPRRAAAARTAAARRRRGRRSPRAASSRGTRAGRSGRPCPSRTRRRDASPSRGDSRLPMLARDGDRSGSARAAGPTRAWSSAGIRAASPRLRHASPTTPSASTSSRSTRPSTTCRRPRRRRNGRSAHRTASSSTSRRAAR